MRLRYTRPALADLDAILAYIAAHAPQSAARVHARIETVITHPNIGAQTDDPTIRRLTATPYPYLIFYEVAGEDVIIHAVRHGARDPSGMPGAT